MTQKEKQLLLADLCARLPYGVNINLDEGWNARLTGIDEDGNLTADIPADFVFSIDDIKPYLRQMSSMTKEEKMYVNELIYDKDGLFLSPVPTWVINECDIDKYIDFCNSKHLDYRGLIEKGLALQAPEGMYKTD